MTRKLFSLTLSAFALLLLMGAGVEEDSTQQLQTEKGTRGAQLVQTSETHDQEADQAHMVTAVAGSSVLTLVEDMDRTLTVDGKAVPSEVTRRSRAERLMWLWSPWPRSWTPPSLSLGTAAARP